MFMIALQVKFIQSPASLYWSNLVFAIVHFMQEFIANEGGGEAPLEGSIPDMTSSTELVIDPCKISSCFFYLKLRVTALSILLCRHYVNLQKIYQAKSEADFLVIEKRVRNILKKIGRDPNSIPKATIKSFCKNARKLKVSVLNCICLLFYGSIYCLYPHWYEKHFDGKWHLYHNFY